MRPGLLARHPELAHHSSILLRSGSWDRWQQIDPRLSSFESLDALTETWAESRSVPCYPAIAALARLGSRRGADDDDATLAFLVALHGDVDHVSNQLRRICDPDDVMRSVWDVVKRAEPQVGIRAPYFLLHRAKEALVIAHGTSDREVAYSPILDGDTNDLAMVGMGPQPIPGDDVEIPWRDLGRLLHWAAQAGVVPCEDAQLVLDIYHDVEPHRGIEKSLIRVGARLGVGMRTVRRRRDSTVRRLREAIPDYLAAAS